MGLLPNPLRAREPQLPLYQKVNSPTKERYSDDDYSTDEEDDYEDEPYSPESSSAGSSRHTSGSASSGLLMLPSHQKKPLPLRRKIAKIYPYRMPNKVTRYLFCTFITFIIVMVFTLVRASQVENWKVANGKVDNRPPPPPPAWEKFHFMERYYGGLKSLVTMEELKPEWPHVKNEPEMLGEGNDWNKQNEIKSDKDSDETDKAATEEIEAVAQGTKSSKKTTRDEKPKDDTKKETKDDAAEEKEDKSKDDSEADKKKLPKSKDWSGYANKSEESDMKECFLDVDGTVRVPQLRYYNGRPQGFPEHAIGSYETLNLPEDICFDRYGRYGPYGFGYSSRNGGLSVGEHGQKEGSEAVWEKTPRVDYRQIDWADVQRRCFKTNQARFKELPSKVQTPHGFFAHEPKPKALPNSTLERRGAEEEKHKTEKETSVAKADQAKTKTEETKSVVSKVEVTKAAEPTKAAQVSKAEKSKTEESQPEKSKSDKSELEDDKVENPKTESSNAPDAGLSRTAVVVRCWDEYNWREDDIANLRSLIAELAVTSGGRYDIHLLVQVKNEAAHPVWADERIYQERIEEAIPEEFRGLVTLWSETQMLALYQGIYDHFSRGPDLPVHGVYRGLSMAMQYFAHKHPEYDYFWQWEMDVRYTGHYYDLFSKLENWSKAQPRKGLWERNSRFYFPSIHGTWEDFSQMARVQSQMGVVGADNVWKGMPGLEGKSPDADTKGQRTVWGPLRPKDDDDWFEPGNDPVAPTSYEKDHSKWGVGEEADYIALNPIFNPDGTTWGLKDDITGFNRSEGLPPRRANIITTARMSRRLLTTMHKMTAFKKQFAFPEMWPATVALQHGFKAVSVPHPVYVDRAWPEAYMAQVYNNGRDGSSGGSRTSIFGDREHNMHGLSWFYNSGFAPNMYRRWLGLRVNNDGGEEFEVTEDKSKKGKGVGNMRGGEGRMCLPPMLLHPVKDVELPVEAPEADAEEGKAPQSDPGA
ncbi:Major facilitator superfamily transporter [Fusarium acuminatum]|uniref:Major facilitator superfamily transporter n=1 Tax=Fusarium acuminatum TaxID=5515 RepID=A0ABZ2WGP4_9HYPO